MAKLPQFQKRTDFVPAEVPKLCKLRSSMAKGIAYDASTQTLTLHMSKGDNVYQYIGVSEEVYEEVHGAESVGRAVNQYLVDKDGITCIKIAENYTA